MANNDVFATLVSFLADLGHEVATLLTDPDARVDLLARAGRRATALPPAADPGTAETFAALRDRASADGPIALELLRDLANAMIDLVALVQEVTADPSADASWNLIATWLDMIAIDRLRNTNLEVVALLKATHLLSDERLLVTDLIRARDQWGSFLLGNPTDDGARADNMSLLLAATFAVIGKWIPQEDNQEKLWRTDMLFGWDPDPASPAPRAQRALQRTATLRFTHRDPFGGGQVEEHAGFSATVVPPTDGGWGLFFALDVGAGLTFSIGQHLELVFQIDSPAAIQAFFGDPPFVTTGLGSTNAKILLRRKQETADHLSIGSDENLHLEIGTFTVGFEIGDPIRFHLAIGGGALVIPKSDFGFMGSLMPEAGVKFTFDADLAVDIHGNLAFTGGAGMTVTLPVNRSLLILRVRAITLAFALEGAADSVKVSLAATVGFGLDFGGAFKVDVDNIGAKLAWALPSSPPTGGNTVPIAHGNLGPYGDIGIDLVPPRGIGVLINAGPVKGGGFLFLDVAHRTYAGVLEASLALCGNGIQIKAAGLLRETDSGWDFVLILSAQFQPAIEIFLGLTLNGVGGMLGINVSVDVDKLRADLHDGSISRLLFPDDPVANAPAIIATMTAVFPDRPGGLVVGPMLQIGWGRPNSFVTLSVAVVLTSPSPEQLLLLGSLRIKVPDPALPLVNIQADFLGVIDFQEPSFSFDASLVNSHVSIFPVTGDMTMRAGSQGFILAIGGFNPRFTPPANVPALHRISLDISPHPIMRIHAEAYLAITSNTFQIGTHTALDIDAGVASVHGWIDFDALIQWEPRLFFAIHMDVGLELRVGGESIAGVSVDLLLEGPAPWHAKGEASLHFLFFTVHAGFEVTWGESDNAAQPPAIDASARVAQALTEEGAWTSIAPNGDSWITFRATDRDGISVHPYGQLSARQQAVPIGIPITRIGQSHVVGGTATVTLTPSAGTPAATPTTGHFAAAQFTDLTDDQKLSRPSFESYQDGISFGATGTVLSSENAVAASYETVIIPSQRRAPRVALDPRLFAHGLTVGSVARSGLHFASLNDGSGQRVTLTDPTYRVAAADTLTSLTPQPVASSALAHQIAAGMANQRRVLVVGAHEVVS
jgi:hypothetical protein